MIPNRYASFLLLLLLPAFTLFAQPQVPEDYLDELEDFVSASRNKSAQEAFANFYGLFLSGAFTVEEQMIVVETTNRMQENRVRSQGGFISYFKSLEQIKNFENGEQQFQEWHVVLNKLLDETPFKINRFDNFLAVSMAFLYRSALDKDEGGTDWFAPGGKVSWFYDGAPKLKVEELDFLSAISADDSISIKETNIIMNIATGEVTGSGGLVNWERLGLDPEIYAELVTYSFTSNRNVYTASEARMHYPEYFADQALTGTFTDRTIAGGVKATSEYPQFTSQDGYVEISDIGEGIDLRGNFEIRGSTVYAIGDEGREAEVELFITDENGERKLKGLSDRFSVRQGDRVIGDGVETVIYFGEDSLYHPSVSMKVNIQDRIVQLVRTKSGADQNPFYHSLNRVNIYADYLDIFLNQDSILIGKPTVSFADKGIVRLESEEFFSKRDYYRIQNIAEVNPLALLLSLREQETGNDFIDVERVAKRINPRFTGSNIQSLLFELAADGFITYDIEQQRIRLKSKVSHYVRSDRGLKDYDRIRLTSDTKEVNGVIDLRSGQINLVGVKPIEFNPSKRIAIRPTGNAVLISGDRNFDFDGDIFAGFAVMEGKDFHFKYQPYNIVLDSVRYLDFFIPDPASNPEEPTALSLASRIEHMQGMLLLDAPRNKSGKQDIAIFPSLRSKGNSYIFYDQADTLAAYDRDSFFFEIKPFVLDRLNTLAEGDMSFDGTLVSGGIFPDIEESVSIQEDGSLGFVTETPEEGRPVYEGRGEYQGQVALSNAGLFGIGRLSYIGADIDSEDIRFELDRTTASALEFNMEEEESPRIIPQVRGQEVAIDWRPYADSMLINSTEGAPFEMYKANEHTFDGTLVLTPDGLKASGTLEWSAASLYSDAVDFGIFSARADTADVRIKSLESDERLALSTTNVNASVDFEKQVGTFENNTSELATTLPYNQYQTSIKKFDWDMAGNSISFRALPGELGRFTSTHPDQDSLTFLGDEAIYDLNTSMLDVSGVDSIKSADAIIFPPDGQIRVEPGARITEFSDAQIVADTINRYHVINRATVNIRGRRRYEARGFYEYNVGPHEQELELQNIVGQPIGKGQYSEKATATRAEGRVEDGTTFYIDNKTRFQGTINLDATSRNLFFDGYAKIESDFLYRPKWFTVRSEGDKKNLNLKIDTPKDQEGGPLFTGFYLSKERQLVYPSIVQTLDFRKDHPILPITGLLNYDEENDRFLFGDSLRITEGSKIGNIMILDNRAGTLSGEGQLGVGGRLNYVGVKTYGRINMDVPPPPADPELLEEEAEEEDDGAADIMLLEEEEEAAEEGEEGLELTIPEEPVYPEVNVEMMAGLELVLPQKLLNLLMSDIKSASFASPALNLVTDGEFYRDGVNNLFPAGKEREEALQGMALGYIDLPKKINPFSLLFSRLKLRWNSDYQSFVSTEKLTGIVSIDGESINKMLEVHVEFKMPQAGDDRFYIYIKSPSELFYFFGFKDGIMNVTSNNTTFMQELESIKPKDLVMKMEDGGTYEILPVELGTASTFLRRVQGAFD